jgi:hypothetical protein
MATIDASFVSGRPARGTDWLGRTATFCYLSIAEPPYLGQTPACLRAASG